MLYFNQFSENTTVRIVIVIRTRETMWPFNRKKTVRDKSIIKKLFSRHIDERLISLISDIPEELHMNTKHINFVMILVNQDSHPNQIIGDILTLVQKYNGMVESITGTFVTIYFGAPIDQPNQRELRLAFIAELSDKLGPSLAVLHGECECQVGNVGNEQRMAYTAFLPEYKMKLSRLSSLAFGQIIKY